MSIREVRVANDLFLPDSLGEGVLYDIKNALGISTIDKVRVAKVYRLQGINKDESLTIAQKLLAEDVFQNYTLDEPIFKEYDALIEVAYKPGVMNPEASSILKSVEDLGIKSLLAVDSSREYAFYGEGANKENIALIINKLLVNKTVERIVIEKPQQLLIEGTPGKTQIIPLLDMNEEELMVLSKDALFLNLEEMLTIQNYFKDLGRNPTDCEIETLAQTWSEHCGHKTFRASLIVNGKEKEPLLKRLKKSTEKANHPLVLSAFVDNSGVIEFFEGQAICGKVETHNSPSAIEPYGGAMTGSGGVFRDIMGTGKGAKVVASTDMFCFAPPQMDAEDIPEGCLHPHYLLRRVVTGVKDYGNRMGIPTNNGSVHFHEDFRAKPSIIVGAYGILPADGATKGEPKAGDLAVVLGGRTGRDGIHGATFSSGEMTSRTIEVNSSAVQIGNAIEEKRTAEALLEASKRGIIQAVTDCGAGGFSSALGEMGEEIGVKVYLEKAPLKYPGLSPWEIWLSESQERMVLAVSPDKIEELLEICRSYNVEATVLAEFTGDANLTVSYENEIICSLSMDFLHNGLPQRQMKACWQKPQFVQNTSNLDFESSKEWEEIYQRLMAHLDVCSKEPIVRVYDHGVQGSSALPPFGGEKEDGPNDAVILAPILGKDYGMVISHGLNPVLNNIHPYWGSLWSATEAVANAVAVGANPKDLCLIDNFIWPFPDEESLGALDLAVDACVDFVEATGMPFISGKDSLSSTYRGKDGQIIKIPPVLCVSVFGRILDIKNTLSSDFKEVGSKIYLVGKRNAKELAGSVFYQLMGLEDENLPQVDLKIFPEVCEALYNSTLKGKILSCHDISEGGLACSVAEMCFGGNMGLSLEIPKEITALDFMFNETAGCFVVETKPDTNLEDLFKNLPCILIGKTLKEEAISLSKDQKQLFKIDLEKLKEAWQKPMKEVFGE